MTAKRVYSVNLAVFLYMTGHKEPEFLLDKDGNVSFLFPDTAEYALLISLYRTGAVSINLRDFIAKYGYIRSRMRAFKIEQGRTKDAQ